jgi:XTP/dITP diphosphohydrolase
MKLVFATNNDHKLLEVRKLLPKEIQLNSLNDIDCHEDIPETGDTLEVNASLKSHFVHERYSLDCFADDTGLEIEALGGEPGVYSARYAGDEKDAEGNMQKVLDQMQGVVNRRARFRTVISLLLNGEEMLFEGIVNGEILTQKHGEKGFGYDPIFKPDGYDISFAQMELSEKNKISHRGLAIDQLVTYLKRILNG